MKGFSYCTHTNIIHFIYMYVYIIQRHYVNTQRSQIRFTQATLPCVISDFQVLNFAFFVVF